VITTCKREDYRAMDTFLLLTGVFYG